MDPLRDSLWIRSLLQHLGDLGLAARRSGLTRTRYGWWHKADGDWSYKGIDGVTSAVDHVFVRGEVEVVSAQYMADGVFGVGPVDHAALVVDVVG